MLLSQMLILLASALLSAAQSPTTSSAVPTHTVAVGVDPHKFTPKEVNASIGDIIEFRFYPTNHSVARAEYLLPCIPYEVTGINKVGIWSGFKPIFVVGIDQPKYQVRINDTQPLFYYCGAPGACLHDGMVGVINPNSTQTWEVQHAFALNATQEFVPGEYFAPEGNPTGSPTTSATTPSSTTSSLTGIPTQTTVVVSPGTSSGLSTGGIAGIAIGAALIAVLAGALFYLYGRQKTMKEVLQNSQNGPGYNGRGSYLSGLASPMSQYPFIDQKLPTANTHEHSSDGRDRYSGVGQIDGHHNRSNPPDSESYRSRSPPIDDRDRDMQIPPLNMNSAGVQSVVSPQDYERRHNSINGAYLAPSPRGQFPEGEEEQAFRQRDSELRTEDVPAVQTLQRVPVAGSQGANMTRFSVHEMPAPSLNSSGVGSYKPPGQIDTRPGGY